MRRVAKRGAREESRGRAARAPRGESEVRGCVLPPALRATPPSRRGGKTRQETVSPMKGGKGWHRRCLYCGWMAHGP